jgi:hypothetical protein
MCIGEIWRRLLAKCLLFVAGSEPKDCGTDPLCAGPEAGIEDGIHAMQNLWELHQRDEDWSFLLIDAKNAFDEQNRTAHGMGRPSQVAIRSTICIQLTQTLHHIRAPRQQRGRQISLQ